MRKWAVARLNRIWDGVCSAAGAFGLSFRVVLGAERPWDAPFLGGHCGVARARSEGLQHWRGQSVVGAEMIFSRRGCRRGLREQPQILA